jgi:hypothetical protein
MLEWQRDRHPQRHIRDAILQRAAGLSTRRRSDGRRGSAEEPSRFAIRAEASRVPLTRRSDNPRITCWTRSS